MNPIAGSRSRLIDVVRRHPAAAFLAWSFTVGQAIAFLPVVLGEVYGMEVAAQPFVVAANLVGLLLPTLVITRIVDGRDGVRRLWSRAVRVRTALRWYLLALVGVHLATTAITVLLLGLRARTGSLLLPALVSGLRPPAPGSAAPQKRPPPLDRRRTARARVLRGWEPGAPPPVWVDGAMRTSTALTLYRVASRGLPRLPFSLDVRIQRLGRVPVPGRHLRALR